MIKSHVTNFVYRKNLKFAEWKGVVGYMKKQMSANHENPKQLITLLTYLFTKKAMRDDQDNFTTDELGLEKYANYFTEAIKKIREQCKADCTNEDHRIRAEKVTNSYLKAQKRSSLICVEPLFNQKKYLGMNTTPLPNEKYFIEIQYPKVQVAYKHTVYTHRFTESDIDALITSNFRFWMQWVIESHFRSDLDFKNKSLLPEKARVFPTSLKKKPGPKMSMEAILE